MNEARTVRILGDGSHEGRGRKEKMGCGARFDDLMTARTMQGSERPQKARPKKKYGVRTQARLGQRKGIADQKARIRATEYREYFVRSG